MARFNTYTVHTTLGTFKTLKLWTYHNNNTEVLRRGETHCLIMVNRPQLLIGQRVAQNGDLTDQAGERSLFLSVKAVDGILFLHSLFSIVYPLYLQHKHCVY